jgi:hypothetical protein
MYLKGRLYNSINLMSLGIWRDKSDCLALLEKFPLKALECYTLTFGPMPFEGWKLGSSS